MAGEENSTGIYIDDICCVVLGLYAAFLGGILRDFSEINFYIVSLWAGERGLCDYVKSVVLTQGCAVRNLVKDYISKQYTRDRIRY